MIKWDLCQECKVVQFMKINLPNTTLMEQRGVKPHIILSIDVEAFEKSQHLFRIIMLSKLGKEGNFLNMIKGIYAKPTANIIPSSKRLKS